MKSINFEHDIASVHSIDAVPMILDVVCQTTGMGFAAVARVTDDRWVVCSVRDDIAFGLKAGGELKIETTICNEIRQHRKPVIIDHVAEDQIFRTHHTPAMYGFQSYISMPIILKDGTFFGTLCAIDPRQARLNTPAIIGMFKLFAELIASHLDAVYQVAASAARLQEEQEIAALREQFIAVLGHDLRNPLGAISSGAILLQHAPLDDRSRTITGMILDCVDRMTGLIENILDFARGHLGSGLALERDTDAPLEPVITQVVDELRVTHPQRAIESRITLSENVDCDHRRIAQLLSNLLGNALTYGAHDQPVRVHASTENGEFLLSVANGGAPITPTAMERLFHPFSRGDAPSGHQGLGLGLYIASQIAQAHGGTLSVSSTPQETCFTLRIPLTAQAQSQAA